MSKKLVIAIDGPAASGKSTAAKALADKLNYLYVDTGAMYRAVTFLALENQISDDPKAVVDLARNIELKLKYENGITRVFIDGKEITKEIRTSAVNSKVSDISKIPEVRAEMVKIQKRMGEDGGLIAEGRDITTVVFPEADLKIFMTAELNTRVDRRYKEFLEKNEKVTLEAVKENLMKRDRLDSEREVSPLKKAEDAWEIDTTNLTVEQEINKILKLIESISK